MPYNSQMRKVNSSEFFARNPIFSLDEAVRAFSPARGRLGAVERLKHHLEKKRLKLVVRGIYAVVPSGVRHELFQPDPFLTAAAVRPDGVFSHHSALELLGAAHSTWNKFTLYTEKRRRPLKLDGTTIHFLEHPGFLQTESQRHFGTRKVERRGMLLKTTGPERTLVEGFRRPALAGGLEELVNSAGGFPTLDLDLLEEVLRRYDIANLWAATGWFLQSFQKTFHVSDEVLGRLERRRPHSPQYLERDSRGGSLASRWNLILPKALLQLGEPNES